MAIRFTIAKNKVDSSAEFTDFLTNYVANASISENLMEFLYPSFCSIETYTFTHKSFKGYDQTDFPVYLKKEQIEKTINYFSAWLTIFNGFHNHKIDLPTHFLITDPADSEPVQEYFSIYKADITRQIKQIISVLEHYKTTDSDYLLYIH